MIHPHVSPKTKQPLRVKNTVFLIIILTIVCFGSFIIGYEMVAITMLERQVKRFNDLSGDTSQHYLALATVMMPLGAIVGCLATGWLQAIGQNKLILVSDAIVICSCLLMARTLSIVNLCVSRLLVGISCGISSSVIPPYIISLAPLEWRGVAGSLHQLLVTIGIGFSFYLGQRLDSLAILGMEGWQYYFILPVIYAAVRLMLLSFFKFNNLESYYQGGENTKLKQFMKLFYNRIDLDQFIALRRLTKERQNETNKEAGSQGIKIGYVGIKGRLATVAMLLLALNQFSGINVTMPYSKQLFMRVSYYDQNRANQCLEIVAVVQVLGTLLGGWLVNRFGRKRVVVAGGQVSTFILFFIFLCFSLKPKDVMLLATLIMVFVLVYSATVGVVPLLYLAQVFPNLCCINIVYWAFCALGMVSSNLMLAHLGIGKSFFLYSIVCLLCTYILTTEMIESSGKTRNELRNEYLYENKDEKSTIQYAVMKSVDLSGQIDENNSLIEIQQ